MAKDVGHLDPHAFDPKRHPQLEVPPRYTLMSDSMGGQLGDDRGYGVGGADAVRDAPDVELGEDEGPCRARGRAEPLGEHELAREHTVTNWSILMTGRNGGRRR